MMKPKNPFIIGKYIGPDYFCDRKEESRLLIHHIENGRNVTLISERRLGKTGLIEHCFSSNQISKDYYCFFIDIYALHNMREFVCELSKEVYRKLAQKQVNFSERFASFVRSLKTSFSYDQFSGMPEMSISLGEIYSPEVTLDEVLTCLEQADRPCIVAIDEFQQIVNFEEDNVEALLRTRVQHLKNVQFVFAGSKKHLMEGIFSSPNRPFYNSVVFMHLDPIAYESYLGFCQQMFAKFDRKVEEGLVNKVYEYFNGITWYLQLFMNEAFAWTDKGETATLLDFETILQHLIDTKRFTFEEIYAHLTEKQKTVIRAMAMEFPKKINPMSKDFIVQYHLKTASSVQTALKGLVEKGLVSERSDERQISDVLFTVWLKKRG